jgi:DNA-binding transcriptional ArsR family regulator
MHIVRHAEIRPSGRKFVMMALADYADEAGECFPHVSTLASYTGQSEKTVRDHLNALEAAGWIKRKRSRREDGTLAGYRFAIQRQNSPVADFASGEKRTKPPAKITGQEPPDLTTSSNNNGASAKTALPDDWGPDEESVRLARELELTDQEISDAIDEFTEFWQGEGRTKRGKKSARGWQLTFRTRLRDLAKRWRRGAFAGSQDRGQRSGGGSLADAAVRIVSEGRS